MALDQAGAVQLTQRAHQVGDLASAVQIHQPSERVQIQVEKGICAVCRALRKGIDQEMSAAALVACDEHG